MVERSSLFRPKGKLRPKKFCKIEGFPGIFGFSIKTGFRTEDEKMFLRKFLWRLVI